MTVGTEGNDQLTNDTSKPTETVSALGGDDVVTINPPRVIASSADIGVDGGSGYDILSISGNAFRSFATTGIDGSLAVRDSSLFNYFVSWTGIEELHLDGALFQGGTYSLGDTLDILHLSTTFAGTYLLQTNGGNDQIYWQSSASGTDITIDAGAGNDLIDFTGANLGTRTGQGGEGNDTLIGSGGADILDGGAGDDVVNGNGGNDTITVSQSGTDTVDGGAGVDTLILDARAAGGAMTLPVPSPSGSETGVSGTATWNGESLSYANIENFIVYAVNADNTINTSAGNDSVTVQGGTAYYDTAGSNIALGEGTDHLTIDYSALTVSADSGYDNVAMSAPTADASGFSGTVTVNGQNKINYSGVESLTITTGAGNDTIRAISHSDVISTGAGNDTIYSTGTAGADHVDGGAGLDSVTADWGDTAQAVNLNLSTAAGAAAGVTLGDRYLHGVEQLTDFKTGAGNDTIALSNFYTDANGNKSVLYNMLDTGAGNDSVSVQGGTAYYDTGTNNVTMGGGADHLTIDYSALTVSADSGYDNVAMSAPAADASGFGGTVTVNGQNKINYSGVESLTITTGAGNDTIRAISHSDVISTGAGDDTIYSTGTAGADHIDAGVGLDSVTADWSDTAEAVALDLSTISGAAAGVTLSDRYLHGVEQLTDFKTGSGNDTIALSNFYTDANNNKTVLYNSVGTGAGNDSVSVQGGTAYYDTGADNVTMGTGADHLTIDYSTLTVGADSGYDNVAMSAPTADASGFGGTVTVNGQNKINYSGVESLTITTGAGNDTIRAISHSDVISTGAGDDTIYSTGTAGADHIDAGVGLDSVTADWSDTAEAVALDLSTISGAAAGVTLSDRYLHGVEQLTDFKTGSGNDTIALSNFYTDANGNKSVLYNMLDTGAGNDSVSVQGGTAYYDTGTNNVTMGGGADHLTIDYSALTVSADSGYDNVAMSAPTADASGFGGTVTVNGQNKINYSGVDSLTITTGAGNDALHGTGGNDLFDAGTGTNSIDGGAGNDTISYAFAASAVTVSLALTSPQDTGASTDTLTNIENLTGSAHDDTLAGNSGDNVIDGSTGADHMGGGAGNDTYIVDNVGDTITENANEGTDEVRTALNSYNYFNVANLENLTFTGTGDFFGMGNEGANVITAGGGNDQLYGNGGADTLNGGGGDDFLVGGAGNDTLVGGAGSDTAGYNGEGGPGGVTASLATGTATDSFGDTDTLIGIENLRGSGNDDRLTGDSGANVLTGNGGDDVLDGGAGNDVMIGGTGDDIFYVDSTSDAVFESAGQGTDEIRTTLASFALGVTAQSANVESLTGLLDTGQTLTGDNKDNAITGGGGDDILTGGGSTAGDYLEGNAGNDRLVVSTGLNSIVHGGTGSDTLVVQLGDQSVNIVMAAPGDDSAGGYTGELTAVPGDSVGIFFDGVEKFDITTGSGNDNIVTGGGDDVIATGVGNDVLDGGAGADTMTGGTGDDVYYVDNAGDVVVENGGEGADEIRTTLASYTLSAPNVEMLTYVGSGDFHGTGSGGSDTITGGSGNDVLEGLDGNDYLDLSAGGNDQALAGTGNDAIYFAGAYAAGDSVDGGTGTDTVGLRGDYGGGVTIAAGSFTNVEVLSLMTSTGGPVGYDIIWENGNLADGQKMTIYAGNLQSGENVTFDGSAETHGYFVMYGGLGNDDLTGGAGSDGFYFGPGKFTQDDQVDGGGGTQNQLGIDGSYDFSASSALGTFGGNFSNIQTIVLYAGDPRDAANPDPNVYHIETNDAAVAAGQTLTIYGTPVTTDLYFDGSSETDGAFKILSGSGNDTLIGGDGNDWIYGNLGADTLTGGQGNDTFAYTAVAQSAGTAVDTITDFGTGDVIDVSQIDADTTQAGDQAFSYIGANAFGHHAGELRVEFDQANNVWNVEGDVDGDGQADFILHVATAGGHQVVSTDFVP